MSRIHMRPVTHINASCHTYECALSHMWDLLAHICMCQHVKIYRETAFPKFVVLVCCDRSEGSFDASCHTYDIARVDAGYRTYQWPIM